MPCRVGITTRPEARKSEWAAKHPTLRNWRILYTTYSKSVAQAKETEYAADNGCEYGPGGSDAGGKWSVYHFIYGEGSNH